MTSLSDPFLLASYDPPRSPSSTAHVHVSYQNNRLTASVQGDGVYILDIASLHPVASHALGPASRFPCASATRFAKSKADEGTTTYTALHADADSGSGCEVRRWKEGGLGRPVVEGPSVQVDYDVCRLYASEELPTRVITLSSDGGVTLLDGETLSAVASHPAPLSSTLLKSFLFPRSEWTPNSSGEGVVLALFLQNTKDKDIHLIVLSVDEHDELVELSSSKIPLESASHEIADISLTPTGYLSLLATSGSWHAYHLTPSSSASPSPDLQPIGSPLHLTNLAFISPSLTKSPPAVPAPNVSLLGLTESHVLLVSPSQQPQSEIVFTIWDLKFGVLLGSHTISTPAALGNEKKLWVVLESAGERQAVVVLSPDAGKKGKGKKGDKEKGKGRSVVLVVPYEVPAKSTLKAVVGKGEMGKKWLKQPAGGVEEEGVGMGLTQGEREVVEGKGGVEGVRRVEEQRGELGYVFVRAVLGRMVFGEEREYDGEVVRCLLERGAVTAGMGEGRGLLEGLRARGDWKAVQLALDTVPDLTEDDLVSLLLPSSSPSPLSLPVVIQHIATYPTSAPALRRAIKMRLGTRPDELVKILEVVEGWIQRWADKEGRMDEEKEPHDLPPLEKTLAFLTTLLDASFLALLTHSPAHPLLRRLSAHLQPEIAFAEAAEQLRGPLEPFVRAVRERKEREEAGAGGAQQEDWRKRRKERFERAGAVGVYQIEELVL